MPKDYPNIATSPSNKDYMAQEFLRKGKPNLPLAQMHRFSEENDKFHFTIISRAKGYAIRTIRHTFTQEQKMDVLQDLQHCIKKWCQITRPSMQRVDGSELLDRFIGTCTGHGCIKTGRNEEEWLENLTPALRNGLLSRHWFYNKGENADQATRASWVKKADEKVAQLKADFPKGRP
ncbi:hypothetical protein B0O99DRAFT_694228 [Bisporella sp. PMI_857]|nr:hypothetical protein B0O99DRAFT_694228 [Bisporella sp. PMI_857]